MKKEYKVGSNGTTRAIQIHPTRLCNLSCLHCYSSSSPKQRGAIDVALLIRALADAAEEGYNYVSISGGEPLLYPSLELLLEQAKFKGFATAIATNGMFLDKKRVAQLKNVTDLVAVSLDGVPESHNRMRNSTQAFKKMAANLKIVQAAEIPFGFIFTLTQYNLNELDWVVNFALQEGAQLLQIHPLENAGFASAHLMGDSPDRTESAYAYLLSETLQQNLEGKLRVQMDFATRVAVLQHPESVYAAGELPEFDTSLADCIASLAIEPDGMIVPVQYGFSRDYAIGNLHQNSFRQLADDWRKNHMVPFYGLCHELHKTVTDKSQPFVFNWNEMITAASHQPLKRNWNTLRPQQSFGSLNYSI
ncbi:MAG: radical SAM/SPASM domain-containing protein [Methylicorpusculum sp.]|uniref:radical SAM protein n=1 Tax=Methylicorpusculum sp. TaxID=2713644 RepID=UPI00271D097D|nr:radical SAM/SPASM domain-containing protein [Methylicorpusculum sp.]MDO8940251.1 radical SAM/SPASM domain-containing protein [Methylicorpusculum sp.]MDP2201264.1 radical SAM/SPASM domain-containing protein [Methylicorpusculum sp.]